MASEENVDTTRKSVKTFVPAYQKDEWKRHADELDMSQSEFVRTMVQAGRRDFEIESVEASSVDTDPESADADDAPDSTGENAADSPDTADSTGGDDLDEHVLSVLSTSDHLSWDELLDELTNSIEDRLEETLQRLQRDNCVQYSGRRGGYTLVAGNDGD
ncbi:DUF5805 domain-containing protein [Halorussus gelatinilyticus]|uniref:DUF5805 domain-containing protein n=1 Tax=Halorussus gelatinilyticus TaxID=2937524 RepID=A0A8U0IHN5_9EURY|nr:DUF5805 domain-containing protein [Halorussus gelatinilyticus]UPV99803.1 DUF5805 domain-containing protein [Halorussus gelatinilyticus]